MLLLKIHQIRDHKSNNFTIIKIYFYFVTILTANSY